MKLPSFLHRQTLRDRAVALRTHLKNFWVHVKSGVWLKSPIFWAKFLGYSIPLGFFLYILYLNYLPFGYHKTFTIDVGTEGDTTVSEFYLEPSPDLSERKTAPDGTTYRDLNGTATAIFKPKAVPKDAKITIALKGTGVSIVPHYLNLDPNSIEWDNNWDFTKEIPSKFKNRGVFVFDNSSYFNGESRLALPDSADVFEDGPFTVYVEWKPVDPDDDLQQIIGHHNWELTQGTKYVEFSVGKMNDADGKILSIQYPISNANDFFNKKHEALAIYSPSYANGRIELYIDKNLVDVRQIGSSKIWADYNKNNPLSLGKSSRKNANYFKGMIFTARMKDGSVPQAGFSDTLQTDLHNMSATSDDADVAKYTIVSDAASNLSQITLRVN